MSLVSLVKEDNWQGFDLAWMDAMQEGADVADLIEALAVVAEKRRMPRCLQHLREHAARLVQEERAADAAFVLGAGLLGGGSPSELWAPLYAAAQAAWSAEPWWPRHVELARFEPETPKPRQAWRDFREMMQYRAGTVVFHPAGWGVGEVLAVDAEGGEVQVRFESGRADHFPLRTAVDIFQVLAEDDLRTQSLRDKEGLRKRLKEDPLAILRSVLGRFGGRASSTAIKNALAQVGITGNAWTSWWRRARPMAENDPWFKVSGRGAKVEVQLLARAVDPAEGLLQELRNANSLSEVQARVRDVISGADEGDPLAEVALDHLAAAVAEESHPIEQRVSAWMFLREHRNETPPALLEVLREAAALPPPGGMRTPRFWELLQSLPTAREQERAVSLLEEVLGESWLEVAARDLPHLAPGMVKGTVEALHAAGQAPELARHYRSLLARPARAPFLLIALTRLAEEGRIEGEFPTPAQRAQALVELAVHLFHEKKGDSVLTRAHQRLLELLTRGTPPLLSRLLESADTHSMRSLYNMLQRGVEDAIDTLVTDRILEVAPEIIRGGERPFWEDEGTIWTTRYGLRKREGELRELHRTKIPANREAIARAASYGDLSENAEWEQAIEEQRQLADAAQSIERELRSAGLIEQVPHPENTICPGVAVRYREVASGKERRVLIVGPWDGDLPDAISYRAPLAQGMLGLHSGARATVQLPQGSLEIEILAIEDADLEGLTEAHQPVSAGAPNPPGDPDA